MTKNSKLLKTNLLISLILIIGFSFSAIIGYRANFKTSLNSIEHITSLSTESIYHQLTAMLTKPVNVSLTMSHDSLLADHLRKEGNYINDDEYIGSTKNYLNNYKLKYKFDSVFLVSTATGRYYTPNDIDRVLTRDNPENVWYFSLLDSGNDYSLNVDNDEVNGANNEITVFVNCKIKDTDGSILGIVGVGIRIDSIMELLRSYEDNFGLEASLINENGIIEISTVYTGYEKTDWFEVHGQNSIKNRVLSWRSNLNNLEIWTKSSSGSDKMEFIASRFIPELSWSLIIKQDTDQFMHDIKSQLYKTCMIIAAMIATVVLIITALIRNFNRQITELLEKRQTIFKKATEHLYDSIYELNLTKNCYVGKQAEEYFKSMGAGGLPIDKGLETIAKNQVKEEFRKGYVETFTPENAIKQYEAGNKHLQYDFMISTDGSEYQWMRVDAYLFYSEADASVHMFTYHKNIDAEKKRELLASTDEATGFFTKTATERLIDKCLTEKSGETHAFFIFDIDNFKQVNDCYGHAFGDYCICKFTEIIQSHFRKGDILGRIGGDEFVAFIPVPSPLWAVEKADELSQALNTECFSSGHSCKISSSIGISIAPHHGTDFETLYRNADAALYRTKQNGKNGFMIYE